MRPNGWLAGSFSINPATGNVFIAVANHVPLRFESWPLSYVVHLLLRLLFDADSEVS